MTEYKTKPLSGLYSKSLRTLGGGDSLGLQKWHGGARGYRGAGSD